ncbi:MAG: lysylphosphatidylglycerol synthase domain-containing protein [Bacteroidota bacterium]
MRQTNLIKTSNFLIKFLIIILSFGFIIHRLVFKYNAGQLLTGLQNILNQPSLWILLLVVVLMMPLNWSLETQKWRFLIRKIENLTFMKAFQGVFAGITMGTFTPNRSGENLGRVFILEKANRWEGVFITFIGSLSQILTTLVFGSAAFLYFFFERVTYFTVHNYNIYLALLLLSCLLTLLTCLLYFRIAWLKGFIRRFVPGKYELFISHLTVFSSYSTSELLQVWLFSIARYLLFAIQFYILLWICGIYFSLFEGIIYVGLMYLFITAIPSITLTEIGIRGSVGIFLLEIIYFNNPTMISQLAPLALLASFLIWVINLIIPALIGEFFILKLKFFRK